MIVDVSEMITLVGGGDLAAEDLQAALTIAPVLVAADSGADKALAAGVVPQAVIGDLDSISPGARAAVPESAIHHIPEQDSTDFDKALRSVKAPLVLALGFLGARLDHSLAALNVLVRQSQQPCILIGEQDVAFLCPLELRMTLPVGTRFSLFPMGPVQGQSTGLRWPLEGLEFSPTGMIGTSNEVCGDPLRVTLDARAMIAMVPRTHLKAVIKSLTA